MFEAFFQSRLAIMVCRLVCQTSTWGNKMIGVRCRDMCNLKTNHASKTIWRVRLHPVVIAVLLPLADGAAARQDTTPAFESLRV